MTQSISLLSLLCLVVSSAYAFDDGMVNLLEVSSSGRTIYLDRGTVDGIKEEEYGVLMLKEETSLGRFTVRPVAKIRSVKALSDESVWVAYQVFENRGLVKGAKLTLLSESSLLKGRAEFTSKRTNLVTRNDPAKEVKDFLLEGDSLAKKKSNYKIVQKVKPKEAHQDKIVDLVDVNEFEDRYGDGRLFIEGIYKSPRAQEFQRRKRVHAFEKMVVAYFKKANSVTFDPAGVLELQNSSDKVTQNTYDQKNNSRLNTYNKRKKLYDNLRKKGARWSKDYTDEELSDILETMDTEYEIERRKTLLAYNFNYQGFVSMGFNLINNENVNDFETTEQSKYNIEVAAESYFLKQFRDLKTFTIELSGRFARDAYFGGELNAKSLEYSVAAHLNWYPFRRPSTIDANIVYIGAVFRYGFASLSNETNNETGNYQIFGFPGIRGGVKYNFTSKYGIRLTASIEELRSERIVRDNDIGTLPDRARYYDGRIGIGLSKFF
ncbi:MAG: hypothetical protein CME65_14020 [Halobacteriovoraceae bacterium]|nr:hypothetical protein [Halobacteriovoraceae bacterium]